MRLRILFGMGAVLTLGVWLAAQQSDQVRNPFNGNAQAIAAGQATYTGGCENCHGSAGRGTERGPSLTSGRFMNGNSDNELFQNIKNGIIGTEMRGYTQFSSDQVWQLVAYVRSLSGQTPAVLSEGPVSGDAVAGKAVFESKGGCLGCHQVNGAGKAVGPDLSAAGQTPAAQLLAKITNPNPPAGRGGARGGARGGRGGPQAVPVTVKMKDGKVITGLRRNNDTFSLQLTDSNGEFRMIDKALVAEVTLLGKSLMPDDFSQKLTAAEIQNVVAYLKSLRAPDYTNVSREAKSGVTYARLLNAQKAEPQNWMHYWGDYSGRHYSPLSQINTLNVKNLQMKWALQMPGDGVVQGTPLVVDGVMYATATHGIVYAVDARTGRQIWRYQRQQKVVNPFEANRSIRGVAIHGHRLFLGTLDAALVCLDARTGAVLWEIQVADTMKGHSLTSPPLVLKDKIISGISGGEYGIRGFIDAYDPVTGKRLWRTYTVPDKGELHADTWGGESYKYGSSATWLTGSYDPDLNTVYWTAGNPSPAHNGEVRPGDNLYSCSVLALDPDTGKIKWHYQFTPHDTHDWDANQDVILVDRMWNGQMRKLLLQASRNGIFYVLDRTNGKLLSGVPFVRSTWSDGFDANGRPKIKPESIATPQGVWVYPSLGGGSNYQPPSYSPITGWMYFHYFDGGGAFSSGPATYEAGRQYQGNGGRGGVTAPAGQAPATQGIMAWDPIAQKRMWKFEFAQNSLSPGVLATAGGVVFAASVEGNFMALDARTGKALWKTGVGGALQAAAMSYGVNGKQFVAISSAGVLYSFGLPE